MASAERAKIKAARKRHAFVSGLITGLNAPAMLITGTFEAPLNIRRTTLAGTWKRTGDYIRSGSDEYRSLRLAKREP